MWKLKGRLWHRIRKPESHYVKQQWNSSVATGKTKKGDKKSIRLRLIEWQCQRSEKKRDIHIEKDGVKDK